MRLKIAARQSDLAKLQAYQVAEAICAKNPDVKVEFQFRASLGDLNQQDPLWKMPERGVFTEDFVQDLEAGKCDMVVHSWKDLPTEARKNSQVVATLPRVDLRDVLLFRKDRLSEALEGRSRNLRVLTSSPRRAYNLAPFLKEYLPFTPSDVEFVSVRGNIPTRLKKLLIEDADALVVAKAALDRLLGSPQEEFAQTRSEMRDVLNRCEFMVLPLSLNPTAAAQGALAIEIKNERKDLIELLSSIHCSKTFEAVNLERNVLSGYGGGCHQKIGVSILPREYGNVMFLRGLTDSGEVLNQASVSRPLDQSLKQPPVQNSRPRIWPEDPKESFFFNREAVIIKSKKLDAADLVWIARENAWPEGLSLREKLVWCAGLQTWKKLAARGLWVHGTSDSLGESELPNIDTLVGRSIKMTKLTHAEAPEIGPMTNLATYKLVPKASAAAIAEQFEGKTHFFWMSGSTFDEAIKHQPRLRDANHACGPGHTYTHLRKTLGDNAKIEIHLGYEAWKRSLK